MKPQFENLAANTQSAIALCYGLDLPSFDFFWHYHPEMELTYVVKGEGLRLVGDSQAPFGDGDLVLLGPHLPHTWVTHGHYSGACVAEVLQFRAELLRPLLALADCAALADMLQRAGRGLHFPPGQDWRPHFGALREARGPGRLARLLDLLGALSAQPAQVLASAAYVPPLPGEDEARLRSAIEYVQAAFHGVLSLDEAARRAHLSKSAFCHFFKRRMGKTFSDYVNDTRIAYACLLLAGSELPIGEVAAASGFDNLAYFNRVFLKKRGITPRAWRRGVMPLADRAVH